MNDFLSSLPTILQADVIPLLGSFFYDELVKTIDESKLWIKTLQYQWKWNIHQRHSRVQRLGGAIARARNRGVVISAILNRESPSHHLTRINQFACNRLAQLGCEVKMMPASVMLHTKLWVIDGRFSFVGSHNLSGRSLGSNEEATVKIESVVLARYFKDYFERLWRG